MIRYWTLGVFLIGLISVVPLSAEGQSYGVIGLVTDSTAGTPLVSATVILLMQADSSLVHFTTTRKDGVFSFPKVAPEHYILQVTYVGMQTAYQPFLIDDQNVDLGNVQLSPSNQDLEEFVVTANRLPFVVRGDTIEYHAMAFVVRPMDMVEDLLRRLPGIEVDPSGTVYAHGRTVENVLVEDKEFFGNDPTIATRNLPAESVDRVQVYDKASDRAELTGIPDGRDERTINLELTEEAKKGAFGQIVGGLGGESSQQERYFTQANVFRFTPRLQFALFGGAENVNQPSFSGSMTSAINPVTLTKLIPGGVDGLRRSAVGGVNTTVTLGAKSDINVSYFLVDGHNKVIENSERQQSLGNSESALSSISEDLSDGMLSHDLVLNADFNFEEGHRMVVNGNFLNSRLISELQGIEHIFSVDDLTQKMAQTFVHDRIGTMSGYGSAVWSKRISESGRSLVVETTVSAEEENELRDLFTETDILGSGELRTPEESHQLRDLDSYTLRNFQRLELIQPLRSGRTISVYLERSNSIRTKDHTRSNRLGEQWEGDLDHNSTFKQNNSYLRPGVNFSLIGSNQIWSVTGNLKLQHSWQKGHVSYEKEQPIRNSFTHLLPYLWGRWDMDDNSELNLFYRTETREPSVRQIQPFEDRKDPLRIFTGNPTLTPEYWHHVFADYKIYQSYSGLSFNSDAGVTYTHNSIVRAWTVEEGGLQNITYINSSPTWAADAQMSLGKTIRTLGLGWNTSLRADLVSGSEFVSGVANERQLLRMRARLGLNYFVGRAIEAEIRTAITWNDVQYSHYDALNRRYVNVRFDSNLNWRVNAHWNIKSSLEYRTFDRTVFAGQPNIVDLNASVSRLIFSDRGQVELSLHDVLNQNQIVRFVNSAAYLETSQINTLGRYLMLKVTYKPKTL